MAGSPTFPTIFRNAFIRNHQALLHRKVSFDKTQQISIFIGKSWTGSWPLFFLSAVEQLNKPSLPMPRKDKTLKLNHIVVNRTQQISRFIGKSWTAGHLHFFFY